MHGLSNRQLEVLQFISGFMGTHGVSPSFREIGEGLGIRSTNGVSDHVRALERKGFVERSRGRGAARSLRLTELAIEEVEPVDTSLVSQPESVPVPLLGRIAAGMPISAVEEHETTYHIDAGLLPRGAAGVFALEVHGESMIEDGIYDGDLVFVQRSPSFRRGDILAVLVDGEATVKRVYKEGGRYRLQPSNEAMQPIWIEPEVGEFEVIGPVVGVYRRVN